MDSSPDQLVGEIPVTAKLALGSERLRLVITGSSMIVAHLGKRGAGAVVGTSFFGRLSGALEDLFKTRKESGVRHKTRTLALDEILRADPDNFNIDYADIVSVDVVGMGEVACVITILTKDDKFEFLTRMEYDRLVDLLDMPLGAKLAARRI